MGDEDLYLEATNEVESDARYEALWAKSMAICDGNEIKAEYEYLRREVKLLLTEKIIKSE